MAAPILHSDQVMLNQSIGQNISLAGGTGLLVDADTGAAKTELTMEAALVTNASTKHSEFQGFVDRLRRAYQYGATDGTLTTTNIQAVSTVAGLVALTGSDPNKKGGPLVIE